MLEARFDAHGVSYKIRTYHQWAIAPNPALTLAHAPEAYRPILEAFCEGRPCPGISGEGLYRRAIMLLSVHLVLCDGS
jgi:hypothetical protein